MGRHKLTALTCFVIAGAMAVGIAGKAWAAEVVRIQDQKGHVYINAGKPEGFLINTEVCIYNPAGEIIACGQVRQTSETLAMIAVDNRLVKKIKHGMEARLAEGRQGVSAPSSQ